MLTSRFIQVESSCSPPSTAADRSPSSPLIPPVNWVNLPSPNTRVGPRWWTEGRTPPPHWTGFSPDGNYALIPDLGLDQIVIYKVHSSKPAITPHGVGQSVPGGGPRHMRFSSDGRFIYLLNELSLSVTTFCLGCKGHKALSTTPRSARRSRRGKLQFRRGNLGPSKRLICLLIESWARYCQRLPGQPKIRKAQGHSGSADPRELFPGTST